MGRNGIAMGGWGQDPRSGIHPLFASGTQPSSIILQVAKAPNVACGPQKGQPRTRLVCVGATIGRSDEDVIAISTFSIVLPSHGSTCLLGLRLATSLWAHCALLMSTSCMPCLPAAHVDVVSGYVLSFAGMWLGTPGTIVSSSKCICATWRTTRRATRAPDVRQKTTTVLNLANADIQKRLLRGVRAPKLNH